MSEIYGDEPLKYLEQARGERARGEQLASATEPNCPHHKDSPHDDCKDCEVEALRRELAAMTQEREEIGTSYLSTIGEQQAELAVLKDKLVTRTQQRDDLLAELVQADEALELEGLSGDGPTRSSIRAAIAKVKP